MLYAADTATSNHHNSAKLSSNLVVQIVPTAYASSSSLSFLHSILSFPSFSCNRIAITLLKTCSKCPIEASCHREISHQKEFAALSQNRHNAVPRRNHHRRQQHCSPALVSRSFWQPHKILKAITTTLLAAVTAIKRPSRCIAVA